MPVVLIHQGPTVTAENYRATVQKLAGKDKMESVSDWPVGGLLSHAAGESPSGFRVVDVWESQEACDAFGQHLGTDPRRGRRHRSAGDVPGGDLRFELVPQLRQERRVVRVLLALAEVAVDPRT